MSKRNDRIYRYRANQGPRPRDIARVNQHLARKRTKAALRSYRLLRSPRLYLPDFTAGAVAGMGMLAVVMTIAGLVS